MRDANQDYDNSAFAQLEVLSEIYAERNGSAPYNISYWDPSDATIRYLSQFIKCDYSSQIINYIFTNSITELKYKVMEKLGINNESKECTFTANGTLALAMSIRYAKDLGISSMYIINPSYFSIRNNLINSNIAIHDMHFDYEAKRKLLSLRNEAVWITNPLYSSGKHLTNSDTEFILELLENNIVICDECVADTDYYLSSRIGLHQNFIGIYAPHKSICVNGLKFACIVYDSKNKELLRKYINDMSGGLNIANVTAIQHYLSPNYEYYKKHFTELISKSNDYIFNLIENTNKNIVFDKICEHYLKTISFPDIRANRGFDFNYLQNIINITGVSFIPSIYSKYPSENGFSFRVNLSRDCKVFRESLNRIINYLSINY